MEQKTSSLFIPSFDKILMIEGKKYPPPSKEKYLTSEKISFESYFKL